MRLADVGRDDYLKIDAEGIDLRVVQSAGDKLKGIKRVTLEVDAAPHALYRGAPSRDEVLKFMIEKNLINSETQNAGRQENLIFSLADGGGRSGVKWRNQSCQC
jgi:hypothetical protein